MSEVCYTCSEPLGDSWAPYTDSINDEESASHKVCNDCAGRFSVCDRCSCASDSLTPIADQRERVVDAPDVTGLRRSRPREVCRPCLVACYGFCESCEQWFYDLREGGACYGCYECECGDCECGDCYPDGCGCCFGRSSEYIHDYSYRPYPLRFFDAVNVSDTKASAGVPYLGMELEISIGERGEGAQIVTDARPESIFCKDDSTVDGFEMVTHPMTLSAASELIPFDELRVLRNRYGASAYDNGIHVHVSRDGFSNDAHVFRWFKLFYRNADDVRRIARRSDGQWASFSSYERNKQTQTAEKHYSRKTRDANPERYSAINCQNAETFEVRVFRGSLRRDEIMAALELVDASVEYTRQLTASEVIQRGGWSWWRFMHWADEQGTYTNLVTINDKTANGSGMAVAV